MNGLRKAGVEINRKVLADLAVRDPVAFGAARGGRQAGALIMRDLLAALAELRERLKEIPQADERRLSDLKTGILGRKAGALTQMLGRLPKLDPASKKEVGAAANALKREFAAAFEARERELKRAAGTVTGLDLTMPGRAGWQGGLHLVTQVVDEICEIFRELGFTRAVGPEARPNGTISSPSISPRITRPSTPRIRSTWAGTSCCAPIPRLCRSARSSAIRRPSAS